MSTLEEIKQLSEKQKKHDLRRLSALTCSTARLLLDVYTVDDFDGITAPTEANSELKEFIRARLSCLSKKKRKHLCDFSINELNQAVREAENLYYAEIPF